MVQMDMELNTARWIALYHQLYRFMNNRDKAGVLSLVQDLGYVQIDTVSVIERAHHHTIWTRMPQYRQNWLDIMLAKDRSIFEFWGHAASYLPMEDYRFFLPRMKRFPETSPWEKNFWMKHHDLAEVILERIRNEGPLGAADFEDTRIGPKQVGWWDWKPAKVVLELLMWKGDLMVAERRNFQRIYDLTERILPAQIDLSSPSPPEIGMFYVQRAINAQGISSEWDILNHMQTKEAVNIKAALREMILHEQVLPVKIQGLDQIHYMLPHVLEGFSPDMQHPNRVFLLSPFDNLVILRPRLKRIFNFDYTIECYVPAVKRKYGYWSLPILWKGDFIGRIDLKADRQRKLLVMRNLHLEENTSITKELAKALIKSLCNFMKFNQSDSLHFETDQPLTLISMMKEVYKKQAGKEDAERCLLG